MHKLGGSKSKKKQSGQKKKINSRLLDKMEQELPQAEGQLSDEMQQKRRRLRKHAEIDENQEPQLIPHKEKDDGQDYQPMDEQDEEQNFVYEKYQFKDDKEIQQDQKKKQQAKNTKKGPKNNTKITQFTDQNQDKKQSSKPAKNKDKKAATQMLLFQSFNQNKKLKRRDDDDDFVVPDNKPLSDEDEDSDQIQARIHAARSLNANKEEKLAQKVNGDLTQKECLEIVMKLSLQEQKQQKGKGDLDQYTYQFSKTAKQNSYDLMNKTKPPPKKPQPKPQTKVQKNQRQPSSSVQRDIDNGKQSVDKRKRSQSKKKKGDKNDKPDGPLSGYTVFMTGEFEPYNKDQLLELVIQLGGHAPKTSGKLPKRLGDKTYLFQGLQVVDAFKRKTNQDVTTTNKSKQAAQRNIKIIKNDDIENFFLDNTGKSLTQHVEGDKGKQQNGSTQKMDVEENMMKNNINDHFDDNRERLSWTEKYKPRSLDDIIGQSTQIKDIRQWLRTWEKAHIYGDKDAVKIGKKGAQCKAVLISGDPGLGKTSVARLLAADMNFDVVQYNASDVRNKSSVLQIQSSGYGIGMAKNLQKTVTLMDQVDGMSSGDRGGMAAIIQMIKNTKSPLICICNDRQCEKIRSLANHCFDIRFHKPDRRQIVKRLQMILNRQGAKATDSSLEKIVQIFQNDVRKILSYLQVFVRTKSKDISIDQINTDKAQSKDSTVMTGPFDSAKQLMTRNGMRINQKMECYYSDSQLVPLLVHENYLDSMTKGKKTRRQFHKVVEANQGFVLADILDKKIRKQQNFALMPSFGFMMTVYPTEKVSSGCGWPQFPSFLGKFSSQRKNRRLIRQIKNTIAPVTTLTNKTAKFPYSTMLYKTIYKNLKAERVDQVVDFMEMYNLTPNLFTQNILSIQFNPGKKDDLMNGIGTATKTKLTRTYNKKHEATKIKGAKGNKKNEAEHMKYDPELEQMEDDDIGEQEEQQEEEEIIVKKKKATKKK